MERTGSRMGKGAQQCQNWAEIEQKVTPACSGPDTVVVFAFGGDETCTTEPFDMFFAAVVGEVVEVVVRPKGQKKLPNVELHNNTRYPWATISSTVLFIFLRIQQKNWSPGKHNLTLLASSKSILLTPLPSQCILQKQSRGKRGGGGSSESLDRAMSRAH